MKGFSLLETIIFFILLSILLGYSLPLYQTIANHYQAEVAIRQLNHAIHLARLEAISKQAMVKLYPKNHQWRHGYIISINGHIIHRFPAIKTGDNLLWQGLLPYQYLKLTPQGFTDYQNGSFYYYSSRGKLLKKLIINQAGRVRIE